MNVPRIFESEYRFCLILWDNEPVNSTKLVELCREHLGWSKATTYTVIRRLMMQTSGMTDKCPAECRPSATRND